MDDADIVDGTESLKLNHDSNDIIRGENESVSTSAPNETATTTTAPSTSADNTVDVHAVQQLKRALQQQNVKVKELQATESKLTRLLQMAKRSIENSKREISEKDKAIDKLKDEVASARSAATTAAAAATASKSDATSPTAEPSRIMLRVMFGGSIWCLIEHIESDLTRLKQPELVWKQFANESELESYVAKKKTGEPLVPPPYVLSPAEAEEVRASAQKEVDRVKEEFRRYRVRAEIMRKQKETEIQKIQANSVVAQQKRISGVDLQSELDNARAQIKTLMKLRDEFDSMESSWREKYEKLQKENQVLSSGAHESALASEWRERYENVMKERDNLMLKVGHQLGNSSIGRDSSEDRFERLRLEYNSYRRTATEALQEKEATLNEAKALLEKNGIAFNNGDRDATRRASIASGSLEDQKRMEYLKNILLQYLSTNEAIVKEHMEGAIATVLQFSPEEVDLIKKKRAEQTYWPKLW